MTKEKKAMEENGLDTLIAMTPENIAYSIGCAIPSQFFARRRHAISIKSLNTEPTLIVADMEEGHAKEYSEIKDIRSYREFMTDPIDLMADVLEEKGLEDGKIGVELTFLPQVDYERLTKRLPKASFIGCDELFEEIFSVKSDKHLKILRDVARAGEKAILEGFETIRPGMTENELARIMLNRFYSEGGDGMKILIVGSGERSGYPNCSPTNRVLKKGDLIRVDFIALKEYFLSDFVRMAVVGEPTQRQAKIYNQLVTTQEKILDVIKPGISGADVYKVYLDAWNELGYPPVRFIGHGLGLSTHERPLLSDFEKIELEENMLLCIEPLLLYPGVEGYQVEDEVLVKKGGYEILTNLMDTSNLYEI